MAYARASSRRSMLRGTAAVLFAGTAAASSAEPAPDGALILACHRFAEGEYRARWRDCTAPVHLSDAEATDADWATLEWITATPATTPAGWAAKALALAAWEPEMYDDLVPAESDTRTALLAALLRDMVAPARAEIVARCAAEYGPLGEGYTPDGRWIGLAPTAAVPAAVMQPAPPDAELHATCAAFVQAERDVDQLEHEAADDVFEAAVAESHAAVVRLSGLRARTVSGLRAKAGVCRAVYAADEPMAMAGIFGGAAQRHDVLAWSTLADLVEVMT